MAKPGAITSLTTFNSGKLNIEKQIKNNQSNFSAYRAVIRFR